jgi:cyclohexanone monooxygenase
VRIVEKGGDVGGTWYWNRYPGAQCDTASYVYMPLLEETGYMPSEKYAHGPEILEHCRRIARHYRLYDNALLHTEVTSVAWDDEHDQWVVCTNRGDRLTAQFVVLGIGPLHVPKLPGIPGIETFAGHSFHTSRWDYAYTGGDPKGAPMAKLADKKIALIGTGATSVQAVPQLARACGKLYVLQRTPSSVDVRDNRPTDPEWFARIATPGWQARWLASFTANQTGGALVEDLVMDGWTELFRRVTDKIARLPADEITPEAIAQARQDADFEKMEQIRARVDRVVADHETAQKLKAWYRQLCKRPCFHDEYLQAFNNPAVELIDTDGKGVEAITKTGFVAAGREYEVDAIIYASGFEVGTPYARRAGFEVTGRDGRTLTEHWADGISTLHGVHVHGFPNAFLVQATQGANLISNIPHNIVDAAATITSTITHVLETGRARVEPTAQAEHDWVEMLINGPRRTIGSAECTPGYYNNEGRDGGRAARTYAGYPQGATAYFAYIDAWRNSGTFDGLAFE